MNIKFYLDCDETTGLGHLSRCLNLACHFKAIKPSCHISFEGKFNSFALAFIEKRGAFLSLPIDKTINERPVFDLSAVDIPIFDSYLLSQEQVDFVCRKKNTAVYIDDFARLNFHRAGTVLNFTVKANQFFSYSSVCQLLGTSYYLNKPEMTKVRLNRKSEIEEKNILIFFSAHQEFQKLYGLFLNLLIDVTKEKNIRIIWSNEKAPVLLKTSNVVEFCDPHIAIEEDFQWADVIISGGGLLKYESCYCTIPNMGISTTEEQNDDSERLHDLGLTFNLGNIASIVDSSQQERMKNKIEEFFMDKKIWGRQIQEQRKYFNSDSGRLAAKVILNG